MKQVEVVYSNSMKINRGNYEQEAPFYSAKSILTIQDGVDAQSVCNAEYEQLQAIVEPLLQADYAKKRTDLANIRLYEKDGKKYPSVTSILQPDGLYAKIKNLAQYSERGDQGDAIFKALVTKCETLEPILEKFAPLDWPWDIKQFVRENKIITKKADCKSWLQDVVVFNDEFQYAGEIDLLKDNTLILDVKTGAWKWEQQIAYAKCLPTVQLVAIADLKENKYIELPITDPVIEKAWLKFIYLRGSFNARFGI
jgi:hypothetical protein